MHRFLLFLSILISINIAGQSVANYTSVRNTSIAYSSISGTGSPFASWRNITTFSQDDNRSDFTNIGFDFWYNGERKTQFCVSTNGFLDFSTSTDDGGPTADDFGYSNAAFASSNAANSTKPAIAPFYDDLAAPSGTASLATSIKYLLSGTAPNRTLTVEWINMSVYTNTTPALNFQVQLMESTGVVKVNYGTMTSGTHGFNYSMGLNSNTISTTPTAAQLKELQTVNTNVFSNTIQSNLSVMPTANSQYVFTPPTPANPAGTLTFSGVSQSSMTLNWANWASNEVGYVIYNSTDGITYNFVTQTLANATSSGVTGLTPGTSYFWRVYAVTEGRLSNPLNGTQATTAGGNRTSIASGSWNAPATWTPNGVPSAGENVIISSGNVVSITSTASCNNITINSLGTLQYNGATPRVLTANNVTVNSGGTFNVNTGSNTTHTLVIRGNIVNNGTLNFATDATSFANARFLNNGNQTISGTGATTRFNAMLLDMGSSQNNILDITSTNFTATTNFLTLNNGTFKLSTTNATSLTPFTGATTLPASTGIWLNSTNGRISTGNSLTFSGKITVNSGTLTIGDGTNEDLLAAGGTFSITGGLSNIAGKYYSTGINNLSNFSISSGTVVVPNVSSTSTSDAPFQMTGIGSSFNMTGGLIVIAREGGNGGQDLGYTNTGATMGSVTGGTLQIGNTSTPAGQTMRINTTYSVGNLNVSSANATASVVTNNLNVINHVTINSGTLSPGALNITLGGNWTNNGGTFNSGTGTTILNSASAAQSIFKSGGETFNSLTFTGAGVKTFSSAVTTNSNVTINAGASVDVSAANHQLTVRRNYINNGAINTRSGTVAFTGTVAQTIGGTSITDFHNLTVNNTSGGVALSSAQNLINTLNLNNGTFNTNSQAFTMVSTATMTARIAQITGTGDITGNVIVQRFAPGGTTGWALFGTPVSSALTLNDWDDDIAISCPTCPDGSAAGFLSIYTYDETKPGLYDDAASYVALNTINDPITPNKGYWVYLGTGSLTTTNITLDVTGTVRKFANPIPLTRTNFGSAPDDGWNLIHNPYPSPVRWSLLRGATANLDNAIYVYNADLNAGAGGYATYINNISSPSVGSGGIGDTIPMGQGFYVHSTGATALTAQETNKVGGQPTFLRFDPNYVASSSSSTPLLRLNLKNASGYDDETVLYYQAGATDFFDDGFDAYKMRGQDTSAPTIALVKNTAFQVNGINPITGNFSIPVKARTGYAGIYTITPVNINSFPSGACITLYDKFTNTTTDLTTSNYVFYLADTTTVARFDLNITVNPLNINSSTNDPSCAQPNSGEIVAKGVNAGPWNYLWKNSSGTTIKTSLNKATADTLNNLSGSTYSVEVSTVGMCDNNTSVFALTPIVIPIASFLSEDTTNLAFGAAVNFTNTSTNSTSDYWDFGDGVGFSTATSPVYNYTTVGTFTASLISTSSTGCNDTTSKKIIVVSDPFAGIISYQNNSSLIVKTIDLNEYLIQQKLDGNTDLNFKVTDATGRLIMDYGNSKSDKIELRVDLRNYAQGIYFLTILANNQPTIVKLPVK
jgi:hypothetical protein